MQISIVIPVFNQFAYTRGCLESLEPDLKTGAEIIVVNNGSTDETIEYLSTRRDLKVIHNPENRGCAPAWNQGAAAAGGDWILILNNDVLVARGWLEAQVHFAQTEEVHIVSPAIREGPLNYDFAEYAREFVAEMNGVARHGVAHGVSFMVARPVIDAIGLFDENFRIGVFEDSDFFRRAAAAKFRLATTGSAFIHHFGSSTQKEIKAGSGGYEQENRDYFRRKWKSNWLQRRSEKTALAWKHWWWRTAEKRGHGHSLCEKWLADGLRFH